MKTRIIRIIAAGLAVFALAVGGSAAGETQTVAQQTVDTSWG